MAVLADQLDIILAAEQRIVGLLGWPIQRHNKAAVHDLVS